MLKIAAVLPPALRARTERSRVFAPDWGQRDAIKAHVDAVHAAIAAQQVLHLDYADERGRSSQRAVEPLCLAFWGGSWTLGGWCRLRADFRNFRLDRIAALRAGDAFTPSPERDLAAYLRSLGVEPGPMG